MSSTAVQGAMKKITARIDFGKKVSIHTLRHSYATHLLPVHHFLVTFTVPDRIGRVLRASQRDGYAALLEAGAESMVDVGSTTKSLRGCRLGFFGVLQGTDRRQADWSGAAIRWYSILTFTSSLPAAE